MDTKNSTKKVYLILAPRNSAIPLNLGIKYILHIVAQW